MILQSHSKTSLSKSGIKSSHYFFFPKACKLCGAVAPLCRKQYKKYSLSTTHRRKTTSTIKVQQKVMIEHWQFKY